MAHRRHFLTARLGPVSGVLRPQQAAADAGGELQRGPAHQLSRFSSSGSRAMLTAMRRASSAARWWRVPVRRGQHSGR
jgi:hypothetical protein